MVILLFRSLVLFRGHHFLHLYDPRHLSRRSLGIGGSVASPQSLWIYGHSRRWLAHFELGAHRLDLRRLLFELSTQGLDFLLLPRADHLEIALQLCDRCFLLFYFFVLFEEFV
jgi:hypothetical protein